MTEYLGKIRKALVAGVGSFVAGYSTMATTGNITGVEWLSLTGGAVIVGLATWFFPNEKDNPSNPDVTKP